MIGEAATRPGRVCDRLLASLGDWLGQLDCARRAIERRLAAACPSSA